MTTPAVYQGLIPDKTNGGLTSLQLALANDMANGKLPFGVNLDFLAAMRTYSHSDPLLPLNFKEQGQRYSNAGGVTWSLGRSGLQAQNQGIAVRKTTAPDITRNIEGVMYTILGDDVYVIRRASDCGPEENRFEQVFIGKQATIAAGSFAYYGKKVIFGAPASSGTYVGCCCFIAGTKITMADGTKKNIEDVELGEQVIGKDGLVNTVINFIRPVLGDRKLIGFNNSKLFMTSDHPVYTKDGWKSYDPVSTMKKYSAFTDDPVGQLMPDDTIETLDGQGLYIDSIQTADESADLQVYNFELDGNNTYVANDLIVHNKSATATSTSTGVNGSAGTASIGNCG
jgi:hypothetical protein